MSNASRMPASPPTPSSTSKRRHPYSTSHHSPRAVPSRTPHPYPDDLESRLASLLNKIDRALPASPRTPSCSGIHPSRASDSCHGHPLPPPPTTRADCATPRPPVVLGTGLVRTEKGDPEAAHHPDGELVEATQSRFSTSLSLNTYDSNEEDLFTTIDNLADSQLCGASREPQLAQSPGSFFARKSLPLGSLVDGQAPLHLRPMLSPHDSLLASHPRGHDSHDSRAMPHWVPSTGASAVVGHHDRMDIENDAAPLIALSSHQLNMVLSLEYQATLTVTNVFPTSVNGDQNTGVWFEVAWPAHRLSVVPSFGFLPPAYSQDIFVTFVPEFFERLPALPPQVHQVMETTLSITVNGTFVYTVDIRMLPLTSPLLNGNRFMYPCPFFAVFCAGICAGMLPRRRSGDPLSW